MDTPLVDVYENPAGVVISSGVDRRAKIYNRTGDLPRTYDLNEWDVEVRFVCKFQPGYFRKVREADGTEPIGPQAASWFLRQPFVVGQQKWERVEVTPVD